MSVFHATMKWPNEKYAFQKIYFGPVVIDAQARLPMLSDREAYIDILQDENDRLKRELMDAKQELKEAKRAQRTAVVKLEQLKRILES